MLATGTDMSHEDRKTTGVARGGARAVWWCGLSLFFHSMLCLLSSLSISTSSFLCFSLSLSSHPPDSCGHLDFLFCLSSGGRFSDTGS